MTPDTFSSSELESYEACPYGFYLKSCLKIRPPRAPEPQLDPSELGTLVHKLLEKILRQNRFEPEEVRSLVETESAEFCRARPGLIPVLIEKQQQEIRETLLAFLEKERERQSPRPTYLEWSFEMPLSLPSGLEIRLKGRVDRIDLDRKNFLVIDYKTGRKNASSLQLSLYILAVQSLLLKDYRPAGGLYYHLSDLTCDSGILHADRIPDGIRPRPGSIIPAARWEEVFEKALERVAAIVQQIRQERFVPQPDDCTPNCPFRSLCQVRVAYPGG